MSSKTRTALDIDTLSAKLALIKVGMDDARLKKEEAEADRAALPADAPREEIWAADDRVRWRSCVLAIAESFHRDAVKALFEATR
jgi:hypothetical protein